MVASPVVFAEKYPISYKNVKAKILKTDFARFVILHLKDVQTHIFHFSLLSLLFLAHLWCAYAMALCLSWIVRREVGCVCVEHNYPKMWMD